MNVMYQDQVVAQKRYMLEIALAGIFFGEGNPQCRGAKFNNPKGINYGC